MHWFQNKKQKLIDIIVFTGYGYQLVQTTQCLLQTRHK